MFDKLNVAEVSIEHFYNKDWERCCNLAKEYEMLLDDDSGTCLSFGWFAAEYSVLINLGQPFGSTKQDRKQDPVVYKMLLDAKFSAEFADIIIEARRKKFAYLVIDPEKEATEDEPVLYKAG